MKTGTVKFFNELKKYGFIRADESNNDVFFHYNDWKAEYIPAKGDRVQFEEAEKAKGKNAVNILYSEIQ